MYNKTFSIFNNNIQEVKVNLKESCLEKVLYYRDEGNVSRSNPVSQLKADVIKMFPPLTFLDEHRVKSVCT